MDLLSYITWNADPEIFSWGPVTLRWYGLLFVSGFLVGQEIMSRIFKIEGKSAKDLDALVLTMLIATIAGARLGHCLFYDPEYYLSQPWKILFIWEGGLASHGAAFGIIFGLWLYAKNRPDQSWLWILDRIVITVALGGAFIRLGNFFNSEIIGKPTDLPWAVIFERVDQLPRHPSQLYESISCFVLFVVLLGLYYRLKRQTPEGLLFSIFLVVVFGLRFVYEFFKENQEAFEDQLTFNMGQLLSVPLVILGIYLLAKTLPHLKNVKKAA